MYLRVCLFVFILCVVLFMYMYACMFADGRLHSGVQLPGWPCLCIFMTCGLFEGVCVCVCVYIQYVNSLCSILVVLCMVGSRAGLARWDSS